MKEQDVVYTKTFENYINKKVSQDQIDAVEKQGFLEFSREEIKGGHKVTYAKKKAGLLNGSKKINVFLIDEMPSEDSLNAESGFPLQHNVKFTAHAGKGGETFIGTYGLANGRKFFCIGETKVKAEKPIHADKPADKKQA